MIVYISIGNSDDKLTQARWANYIGCVVQLVRTEPGVHVHGEWFSSPSSRWQNACWCVELSDAASPIRIKHALRHYAREFGQDSIAWAEAPATEFLGGGPDA